MRALICILITAGLIAAPIGAVAPVRAEVHQSADPPALIRVSAARLQTLLARIHFSPGLIDGRAGRKTRIAIEHFRAARGIEPVQWADGTATVSVDPPTLLALEAGRRDTRPTSSGANRGSGISSDEPLRQLTRPYRITEADLALVTGPIPEDWNERAALPVCGYADLHELLAERGWCSLEFVQALNSGIALNDLQAGEEVLLPDVPDLTTKPKAPLALPKLARIEIDLADKLVHGFDDSGTQVCLMHCSIAKSVEKRPVGDLVVKVIATDPEYTFDPVDWPEVQGIDKKLRIAPGPRNPVGSAWIGLDKPGYGLHGTVRPQDIGKTGSHGCFRLANWDAARLARAVKVGTTVSIKGD